MDRQTILFHLMRFFSAYISEYKKVCCIMSSSFAKPALSRTVTSKTNNQLYQLKILSLFKIIPPWLEKFNELRSIWWSAPPPMTHIATPGPLGDSDLFERIWSVCMGQCFGVGAAFDNRQGPPIIKSYLKRGKYAFFDSFI